MRLSEEEQLDVLLNRLRKHEYDLDTNEINHLKSLIRRGIVKIEPEVATDYLIEEYKKKGLDN